ncbi:MAG: hypothetical protein ACI8RD_014475, partial [Bacillariaceae sp.]
LILLLIISIIIKRRRRNLIQAQRQSNSTERSSVDLYGIILI